MIKIKHFLQDVIYLWIANNVDDYALDEDIKKYLALLEEKRIIQGVQHPSLIQLIRKN